MKKTEKHAVGWQSLATVRALAANQRGWKENVKSLMARRDIGIGKVLLNMETFKYLVLSVLLYLGREMDRSSDNRAMILCHMTPVNVFFVRSHYKPRTGHYMSSVILQRNIRSRHSRNKCDCQRSRNGTRRLQTPGPKNSCSYERWCCHPLGLDI